MNDEIQSSAAAIAQTERELAAAQRTLNEKQTLESALAVAGYETSLHQLRTAHDRLVAAAEISTRDQATHELQRELAECESRLTPAALELRFAPLIEREALARAALFESQLEAHSLETELVSVSRRVSELEGKLGQHGASDYGRATANLSFDMRRLRKLSVNTKLRNHAALDPGMKANSNDPRQEALAVVLIP